MGRRGADTRVVEATLGPSRWIMAGRPPCVALRPFVRELVGYEEHASGPCQQRQFPGPLFVLIIEFGPPIEVTMAGRSVRHPGGFVAGLSESFADTMHSGLQQGVQVDLTPTGAWRLLGMPLSDLSEGVVAWTDLWRGDDAALPQRLAEAANWSERFDNIETFLLKRIHRTDVDTRYVDWAVGQIEAARGDVRVAELARDVGFTHKHLITLFREQVGVSPKVFARLVRFDGVMRTVQRSRGGRWADLAAAYGYSDQAHLSREVRRFTGLKPTQASGALVGLRELLE